MKKRSVKIRGIALFILLSATALVILQLSRGGGDLQPQPRMSR